MGADGDYDKASCWLWRNRCLILVSIPLSVEEYVFIIDQHPTGYGEIGSEGECSWCMKSGAWEQNKWATYFTQKYRTKVTKYTWPNKNGKFYAWVKTSRVEKTAIMTRNEDRNNHAQKHGGNRGLNTRTYNWGMTTRCVEKKDKTNGKWKVDQRWL